MAEKVVPLFTGNAPNAVCACGLKRDHRSWRRWAGRFSAGAQLFVTISAVAFAAGYWTVAAALFFETLNEPHGMWWMVAVGFVIYRMLLFAQFVISRFTGQPTAVFEHRHTPQEHIHQGIAR